MNQPSHPAGAPPLPDVTAVLFDLDDTLVPTRRNWQRALDAVAAHLSASHPHVTAADITASYTRTSDRLWTDYDRALAPLGSLTTIRRHVWGRALHSLGIDLTERALASLVDDFAYRQMRAIRPDRNLLAQLDRLVPSYQLGIITNGDTTTQLHKLELAGLDSYFETVVCALNSRRKPDRQPFDQARDNLAVLPGRCLYVGDDFANDIVGAAGAGMHPVWITHAGTPTPDGPVPAARFSTLTSCLNVLADHATRRPARRTEPT